MSAKDNFYSYLLNLQNTICRSIEALDEKEKFVEDRWDRAEGGGGISRVISHGRVFEKGGVNTSSVHGELPQFMRKAFKVDGRNFYACGLSLVLHPVNPYVPTVHANWRYFEVLDDDGKITDTWFGGGSDLTPYYIFEEDGRHFHNTLKTAMDPFGEELYPKYKDQCDKYFINKHRDDEARGIGGVFYDYLRPGNANLEDTGNADRKNAGLADHEDTKSANPGNFQDTNSLIAFQQSVGNAFLPAYLPIVKKRKDIAFGENEVHWQEIRRGRYAEFNLIHDRGTLFGLKTKGRIESIFMSMPPRARWEYNFHPAPGSKEEELLEYLKPRNWV